MHSLIKKFGTEGTERFIDYIIIGVTDTNVWKKFCNDMKLCTKNTKTIRVHMYKEDVNYEYTFVNGYAQRVLIKHPYQKYTVVVKNGRGEELINRRLKDIEVPEIMEQIKQIKSNQIQNEQ